MTDINHNTSLIKQRLLLNSAGSDKFNPIVVGLSISFLVRFNKKTHKISSFVGSSNFPTTAISFVEDDQDEFLFRFDGIAGNSPLSIINDFTFLKIVLESIATQEKITIEKRFFIASLPSDAVQVFDINQDKFVSVNFDTNPAVIPVVGQMCGIRFFNSYDDEFSIHRFGGTKYFSCFDFGDTENGSEDEFVKRQIEEPIEQVNKIQLNKHVIGVQETHDIQILLKSEKSTNPVAIRIKVITKACFASDIKDPVVSS